MDDKLLRETLNTHAKALAKLFDNDAEVFKQGATILEAQEKIIDLLKTILTYMKGDDDDGQDKRINQGNSENEQATTPGRDSKEVEEIKENPTY